MDNCGVERDHLSGILIINKKTEIKQIMYFIRELKTTYWKDTIQYDHMIVLSRSCTTIFKKSAQMSLLINENLSKSNIFKMPLYPYLSMSICSFLKV